jgi:hypothetical protein
MSELESECQPLGGINVSKLDDMALLKSQLKSISRTAVVLGHRCISQQ